MKENTKNNIITLVAIAAALFFLISFRGYLEEKKIENNYERNYILYEIKKGDTEFKIAGKYKPPGMDSRKYIKELGETNNNINFFQKPLINGSYILVPKYEKKEAP